MDEKVKRLLLLPRKYPNGDLCLLAGARQDALKKDN